MKRASTNNIPLYTATNRAVNQAPTPGNRAVIRAAHIVFFAVSLCLGCSSDDTPPNTNGSESGGSSGTAGTFSTAGTAGIAGSAGSFFAGAAGISGSENQGGIGGSGAIAGTGGSNGGASGDGNDSFETAATEKGEYLLDPPVTDVDFFRLELTEGDWTSVTMRITRPENISEINSPYVDPVMVLYDANGVQIGFNDDALPRINQDSRILFRVPATGTYYVAVQSFCSYYSVLDQCANITFGDYSMVWNSSINIPELAEIEPNDEIASAQSNQFYLAYDSSVTPILASFETSTDRDLFSVRPMAKTANEPLTDTVGVRLTFAPPGPNGTGSTATVGDVTAWQINGDQQSPYSASNIASSFQLPQADAFGASVLIFTNSQEDIWFDVRRESGTGENDFYSVYPSSELVFDIEAEITDSHSNDSIADAAILNNPQTNVLGITSYSLLGNLDVQDTDIFHLYTTPSSTQVHVYCEAEVSGSGIRGLTVDVQAADGTSLLSAPLVENHVLGANTAFPISPATTPEFFLVLSSSSPQANTIPWYYCKVFVE